MRFVCDSCRAQYMISDDKVGAKGVKVRCKKCGHVILVRRPEPELSGATDPLVGAPQDAPEAPEDTLPPPPERTQVAAVPGFGGESEDVNLDDDEQPTSAGFFPGQEAAGLSLGAQPELSPPEQHGEQHQDQDPDGEQDPDSSPFGARKEQDAGGAGSWEARASDGPEAPPEDRAPDRSEDEGELPPGPWGGDGGGSDDEEAALGLLGESSPQPTAPNPAIDESLLAASTPEATQPGPMAQLPVEGGADAAGGDEDGLGGGLFTGVEEDEIGAVFDQVLRSGPQKVPAASEGPLGSAFDDEGDSTRVVSLDALQKLADESAPGEGGTSSPAAAQHDWYVAVNEEQVGPLSLEKIRDLWERGEVGPDSLCWRAGFSDWNPISETSELAAQLAPPPSRAAFGAPSEPPKHGEASSGREPVAPEDSSWRPSAASALASLVQDEMSALAKPAVKSLLESQPHLIPAAAPAAMPGLLDIPDAPRPNGAGSPEGPPGANHPAAPIPSPPMAAPFHTGAVPAYGSPYAYGSPPAAEKGGKGLMIAGIVGGVILLVGLLGTVLVLALRPQWAAAPQVAQAAVPAEVEKKVDLPMPPPPSELKEAEAKADPEAEAEAPEKPAPVAATAPVRRAEPTPRRAARPAASRDEGETFTAPSRGPAPRAEEPGDDDFDRMFGGGGAAKPRPTQPAKRQPTQYIPPPPGSAEIPDRLGQSDVMQVVLSHRPSIVKCVNAQKAKDPGLSGRLVMRWTILTSGQTANISVQTDEFRSTHMASCMTDLVKGWKFPRHKVKGDAINFPFTF